MSAKTFDEIYFASGSVAKTYSRCIQKFNPHHDSHGLFSSSDNATSFTYKPGASRAHDMAIERAKRQGSSVSGKIRTQMDDAKIVNLKLSETKNKAEFCNKLLEAKESNGEYGGYVDSQTPEKLKGAKTYLSEDKLAGVSVKPDGDIVGVFKHDDSPVRGAATDLIITARENGGTKMDCYGVNLANFYEKAGFEVVAWTPFNPKYVDDPYLRAKKPDVYVLKRTADSTSTVIEKIKSGQWEMNQSTETQLKALKSFPGDTGYDEALAYRDSLLK